MKQFSKLTFLFLFAFSFCAVLSAQESNESNDPTESNNDRSGLDFGIEFQQPLVQDGAYEKLAEKERIALPYDHIREADVLWSKRLWRVIDTREKMNLPFINAQQPFISVLLKIIQDNPDVRIFDQDNFYNEAYANDIRERLSSVDTASVYDYDLDDYVETVTYNDFDPSAYTKFRLKEDWLFDEETSMMVCRIIGLAPIKDEFNEDGSYRGQSALFWVYYPEIRDHLAKTEATNPYNDAIKMSWHKVFEDRYFSSYIMKESNPRDRRIEDYSTGRDALKEGERINETILNQEVDLWSY